MTHVFRTPQVSTNATAAERAGARVDRLEYLADIASELRAMAEADGCGTLAGLLALAHLEALAEARRARQQAA